MIGGFDGIGKAQRSRGRKRGS